MDEMGGHMRFYEKMFFGSCLPWENYKKLSSMAVFGHNFFVIGNFTMKFYMEVQNGCLHKCTKGKFYPR